MNIHVHLSYNLECSVEYCFWKNFFLACGIWTSHEIINENWEISNYSKNMNLVILNEKNLSNCEKEYSKTVFCIQSSNFFIRDDIVKIDWEKGYYYDVLSKLFSGDKILLRFLNKMMGLFTGFYKGQRLEHGGLWGATWLFSYAQMSNRKEWNIQISEIALQIIEILKEEKKESNSNWNYNYALIFCEYLRYGVTQNEIYRMRKSDFLIDKCDELASVNGWNSSLVFLASQICLLTTTKNKDSIYYLQDIPNFYQNSDLLYTIGFVYKNAFGYDKKALECYQKAYFTNQNNYRALYRIAKKIENDGNWINALGTYAEIRRIIEELRTKDDISIQKLEYEYKCCKSMLQICKRYVNDLELQRDFTFHLENICMQPDKYVNLDKILTLMFDGEKSQKEEEFMDELQKNLII